MEAVRNAQGPWNVEFEDEEARVLVKRPRRIKVVAMMLLAMVDVFCAICRADFPRLSRGV
jgi:hypothetical protein